MWVVVVSLLLLITFVSNGGVGGSDVISMAGAGAMLTSVPPSGSCEGVGASVFCGALLGLGNRHGKN